MLVVLLNTLNSRLTVWKYMSLKDIISIADYAYFYAIYWTIMSSGINLETLNTKNVSIKSGIN